MGKLRVFNKDGTYKDIDPPKQHKPCRRCTSCDKELEKWQEFGDHDAVFCWDCYSAIAFDG